MNTSAKADLLCMGQVRMTWGKALLPWTSDPGESMLLLLMNFVSQENIASYREDAFLKTLPTQSQAVS